nr:hypothetical protein [Tanacetum cinerariifolium]
MQSSEKTNGVSFSRRPRKASASSKSRKSLSLNGVSAGEMVETTGSSEGVGLPLAVTSEKLRTSYEYSSQASSVTSILFAVI